VRLTRTRTQIIITTQMQRLLPLLLSLVIASTVHAQSGNAVLHGSAPAWANSKNYAGPVDPNAGIGFRVYLGWNNPTAAVALAQAVSDPGSSSYRQYLTPEQFRQQFAPSKAQVAAVQSWLESQGFTLNYTPKNNHYISAQGTVGQVLRRPSGLRRVHG
jgi:subtilase family serine protease